MREPRHHKHTSSASAKREGGRTGEDGRQKERSFSESLCVDRENSRRYVGETFSFLFSQKTKVKDDVEKMEKTKNLHERKMKKKKLQERKARKPK